MSAEPNVDTYLMGRTAAEEKRLQRQALLYEPATRRLFEAAGIGEGMKVLDLGCGPGDVSMLVAEMVGPSGAVVGLDINPTILETARRRVADAGHSNISFECGDLHQVELDDDFDAVVGRLILMYLQDPAEVLRGLLQHVRPGGVAAFYEFESLTPGVFYPPCETGAAVVRWIQEGCAAGGGETSMGMKLHRVLLDAGLEAPEILVDAMTGGTKAFVAEFSGYLTDTIRSIVPLLIKSGIATEDEIGIETLEARLRDEVLRHGSVIRSFLFFGAWATKA